ncbi:hypothetical protein ACI78T_12685 [Blastococcus sp. SYSU D00922]
MRTTVDRRQSAASRRSGYAVAAAINLVLLWLIHGWPGWDAVPFLTGDFESVLGWIDASLVVSAAVNLVHLVRDPRWLTAAGALATTALGLVAAVRLLQVFPFDLGDSDVWPVVCRVLLWVGVVGSAIGVVANLVALARAR